MFYVLFYQLLILYWIVLACYSKEVYVYITDNLVWAHICSLSALSLWYLFMDSITIEGNAIIFLAIVFAIGSFTATLQNMIVGIRTLSSCAKLNGTYTFYPTKSSLKSAELVLHVMGRDLNA